MSAVKFTKDHEWVRVEGDVATIGITEHAQQQLGDVVFVELPAAGRTLAQGKEAAVVESVKAASEVFAPIDGTVIEGNPAVADEPALVNSDAMGDGWFFRMRLSNPAQLDGLMDEDAYKSYVEGLH